jgi:NADH-quinone oxidoreductase subunit H
MGGPYIEYSGKALGLFKLSKAVLTFAIPLFMITLFFGGIANDLGGIMKNIGEYLLIIVLIVVIKNTSPRVRIDQAVRFFWLRVTAFAVAAAALAFLGM